MVTTSKADTPVKFRLDWTVYGVHAPFFLALEKGFYKDEGLDVTISEGQGSATVVQQLAQNQDDVSLIDFSTLLFSVEQGLPVTAVMRVLSNVMCIVSSAENPISSPKELEDKIIAYTPSESSGIAFSVLMAADGGDIRKVSIVNPAMGAKNTLLLQGRVDAIPGNINLHPAQLAGHDLKTHTFLYSDFGVNLMAHGIVASNTFIEKNPEALRGFLRATLRGLELARADPEAAIDSIFATMPDQKRNRDLYLAQWKASLPALQGSDGLRPGEMSVADWAAMQDIMQKGGALSPKVAPENIFSNEYLPAN